VPGGCCGGAGRSPVAHAREQAVQLARSSGLRLPSGIVYRGGAPTGICFVGVRKDERVRGGGGRDCSAFTFGTFAAGSVGDQLGGLRYEFGRGQVPVQKKTQPGVRLSLSVLPPVVPLLFISAVCATSLAAAKSLRTCTN